MTDKRAVWADVIRIVAMFFVVFIHVSPLPQVLRVENSLFFINFAIVKSCIALFFMLSGALLLGKEETYTTFFHKRLLKILLPWIAWTGIYIAVQVYLLGKPVTTVSDAKYLFELTFLTKFWILPVLAGLYLLTPILRILLKKATLKDMLYLLSLWIIFVSLLPFLHNGPTFPLSFPAGLFSQVMMSSGFFIGGYILLRIPKKFFSLTQSIVLGMLGIILTLISAILHMHEIESVAYSIFAPGMVMTATGLFLVCERLDPYMQRWSDRTKGVILTISVASFGVYLIHELMHDIYSTISLQYHLSVLLQTDLFSDYLRACIVFGISTLVVLVLQKIPGIRKFVP